MEYADYGFYTNEYKGKLTYDTFSSLIVKASREINRLNKTTDDINNIKTNIIDNLPQELIRYI